MSGRALRHRIGRTMLIVLSIGLFAGAAQGQPIPTRNQVLIYNDIAQPAGVVSHQKLSITFIGLTGPAQTFPLDPNYVGRVWVDKQGVSQFVAAGDVQVRYSGSDAAYPASGLQMGGIDVLDIAVPPSLGPIVALKIGTGDPNISWSIDKVVADGRTFLFSGTTGPRVEDYTSGGFFLGDYRSGHPAITPWDSALEGLQASFAKYGGKAVLLPTDHLFNVTTPLAAFPKNEAYSEPTLHTQHKTIEVRLTTGAGTPANDFRDDGATLSVQLVGATGNSAVQTVRGPLIEDQRFASFSVPGDFVIDAVKVALTSGPATLAIQDVRVLDEQGLDPEVQFQDSATLTLGGPAGLLTLYGPSGKLTPRDLTKDPSVLPALMARSADDIFHRITVNDEERDALDEFRSYFSTAPHRIQSLWTFDHWFLNQTSTMVDRADDLAAQADAHFNAASNPGRVKFGWESLRPKLVELINNRLSLLQYLALVKGLALQANDAVLSESQLALVNLDLPTGLTLTVNQPPPPAPTAPPDDAVATLFTNLFSATYIVGAFLPEASYFFSIGQGIDALATQNTQAAAAPPPPLPPLYATGDAGSAVESNFRVALSNLTTTLQGQIYGVVSPGGELDQAATAIVRDPTLLRAYAANYATANGRPTKGGAMGPLLAQYQGQIGMQLRPMFVNALLPIRAVIYGAPSDNANDGDGVVPTCHPNSGNAVFPVTTHTTSAGLPITSALSSPPWPLSHVSYATYCNVPPAGGLRDNVMAVSQALYQTTGLDGPRIVYRVTPINLEWRLASYDGGDNPPAVYPPSMWKNYLEPASFTPSQVFTMLAQTPDRLVMTGQNLACNGNADMTCSPPSNDTASHILPLPPTVFQAPAPTFLPSTGGRTVDHWTVNTSTTFSQAEYNGLDTLYVDPASKSYIFPLTVYADSKAVGPVVPAYWVLLDQ